MLFGGSFLENDTDTPSSYLNSPIIGSQGFLLYEGTEDCTASILSAASSAELPATGTEDLACVKELVVKVLPPTLAEKDAKSFAVNNVLKVMLASMDSFKSYLSDRLDLPKVSDVGYYLRGGKTVWLKDSQDLLEVLEQIGSKGRGSIWCVVKKTSEKDSDDIPRAKKKCDGEERRERVQE